MRGWAAGAVVAMATYAALLALGNPEAAWVVKPVPVALLCAGVVWTARDGAGRWLALGLGMSALADAIIEVHFLAGLAIFLAAHLAYVAAFTLQSPHVAPVRALPFAAIVVAASSVFVPAAGGLGPAVGAYAVAIGTMGWRASARIGEGRGGWLALAGAVLFMGSDTLLATHQFVTPLDHRDALVMSTYWSGQLLIALSARPMDPVSESGAAP